MPPSPPRPTKEPREQVRDDTDGPGPEMDDELIGEWNIINWDPSRFPNYIRRGPPNPPRDIQ